MSDPDTLRFQAVVVIHGIGEQQPMDTLRSFVEAVLDVSGSKRPLRAPGPRYYSRPDSFSGSYELRCLRSRAKHPTTDFYELYWAHRLRGATWSRVLEWVRLLLRRPIRDVPEPLRLPWTLLKLLSWAAGLGLAVFLLFLFAPALRPDFLVGPAMGLLPGAAVILLLVQGSILACIGDAAVYLSPRPRNIEARQAIRASGIDLLERLQRSGRYDRILLVGHSLGSIIGYDILTHAWERHHERHGRPDAPEAERLRDSEALARRMRGTPPGERSDLLGAWRGATAALWGERRAMGSPWLVSDFITLGSPLAHGPLLLAKDGGDFRRRVEQLELPVCPPIPDRKGGFSHRLHYRTAGGSRRTLYALHYAAWPAVVRWTNLYFPSRFLVGGDPIAGPVSPVFGPGVLDVPVKTRKHLGLFSHTFYWTSGSGESRQQEDPVIQLRRALDLWRQRTPDP